MIVDGVMQYTPVVPDHQIIVLPLVTPGVFVTATLRKQRFEDGPGVFLATTVQLGCKGATGKQ